MAHSFVLWKQRGFTLIELMVALALGLILVAAATQLFIGGLLSSRLQKALTLPWAGTACASSTLLELPGEPHWLAEGAAELWLIV